MSSRRPKGQRSLRRKELVARDMVAVVALILPIRAKGLFREDWMAVRVLQVDRMA